MATRTSRLSEFLFGKEKKTFLEDIEGVLKIGKIFGCTFFGFTEKWKAGNFVYAIPLYTVYVWCIPTAGEFYKNTFFNKTMVLFFTELIYFIANITVTLSRPFYYLLARKRYKNLLWELNKLFFNLRNGYRLRYKRDFKLFHFYLILLIKMIIYILQRLYTVVGTLSVETQIIFLGGMFFCSADDFVDYSILKHIRRVFRLINEEIERYETPNGGRPIEYDTRTIGYYISIHRKATKLARHFNLLVSPSIVGSIALHVSVVVMLVHYSTVSLYAFWNGTDADINFIVLSNVCIFEISSKFCAMITIWPDVEKEVRQIIENHSKTR